jgi:preprotein translocase subunit SecD
MAAYKDLRWKTLVILAVVVIFSAVGVYPFVAQRFGLPAPAWLMAKQLQLGLDLKGGVHLVMRVNRDDALRISTEGVGEQLREALRTAGVTFGAITVTSPTTFRVEGVPQDKETEFRRIAEEQTATNYERSSGVGGAYDFTMRPNIARALREQTMVQAHDTIDRRVNELGVTEPNIATHGDDGDQLLVQLPGISDVARAKDIIQSTALLELKLVEGGPADTRENLLASHGGQVPPDMEVVSGAADPSTGEAGTRFFLVRKVAAVNGSDLRSASVGLDENSQPAVMFSLKPDGARKFGQVTGSNLGRSLAIVLDDRVQSYPRIDGRITSEGRISGGFTQQEAADLALKLRSGALPASMTYLEERVVGPTLGADSIRSGVTAALAGLALVVVFMLVYYKLSGINAIVAMIINLIILIGMMAYFGATMTLPGIAGFILTMGMGVDSNVLIFERIKEELAANRGARAAVSASFDRVFWTLFDTHVTSLIAAAFLFQFGTGPIRGFATTLFVGLISNLFTSIFVSRTLFEFVLSRRPANAQTVSI